MGCVRNRRQGSVMKIVIPGGSGIIGPILARAFSERGDEVVVLSRRPRAGAWRSVYWDGTSLGDWTKEVDGAAVVIYLAGRSVNCRYYEKNRREMIESRVRSTRLVGRAVARSQRPPRVWLQMSTATIYAHRYDAPNDERTGILGGTEPDAPATWKFSIDVARAWERTFWEAITPSTRKVALRSAMVMSTAAGGVFDIKRRFVHLGLGGAAGDGRQFVSWIHEHDFIRAIEWLIARDDLDGVVNVASPNPLPYTEFMRAIRDAERVPLGIAPTNWMLEIGAFFMRTETELVLKSRRVVPGSLLQSGFVFDFATWPEAARELSERTAMSRAPAAA